MVPKKLPLIFFGDKNYKLYLRRPRQFDITEINKNTAEMF
jgi:hypothetical protein